jgi:hypothetical protein
MDDASLQRLANFAQIISVIIPVFTAIITFVWKRRTILKNPRILTVVIVILLVSQILSLISTFTKSSATIQAEPCLANSGIVIHTESRFLCISERTGAISLNELRLDDVTGIDTGKYKLRLSYTDKKKNKQIHFPSEVLEKFVCGGKNLLFSPPIMVTYLYVSDKEETTCDPNIGS